MLIILLLILTYTITYTTSSQNRLPETPTQTSVLFIYIHTQHINGFLNEELLKNMITKIRFSLFFDFTTRTHNTLAYLTHFLNGHKTRLLNIHMWIDNSKRIKKIIIIKINNKWMTYQYQHWASFAFHLTSWQIVKLNFG